MSGSAIVVGMNIRMPQANQSAAPDSSTSSSQVLVPEGNGDDSLQPNQITGFADGSNFGSSSGMPGWPPHEMNPRTQLGPQPGDERRPVSYLHSVDQLSCKCVRACERCVW